MPLDLTIVELSAAIRLSADGSVPPEPQLTILHRQLRTAESEIDGYAPLAPTDTRSEAAIRMVGYFYDRPDAVNPFILSGARAMLARWHGLVSALVGGAPSTLTTGAPESGLTPSTHPVHPGTHNRYIGWSDGASVDAAELAAGAEFTTDALTIPNRATGGFVWAAFDVSAGFPDSAYIDGNPTNIIGGFRQQPGVLARGGIDYVVLITNAAQSSRSSGRIYTFGYSSP